MAESRCPSCGVNLVEFAAIDGGDDRPKPGDLTICSACDTILIFDEGEQVRLPRKDEMAVTRRVVQCSAVRSMFFRN